MADLFSENGLYWSPLGGNNIDQISGHCYQYTDSKHSKSGIVTSTIIVDIGKFDNHQALGIKNSVAAVPDIRELLEMLCPLGVFLTHSHPDHINGIIHYINAGYKLPTLYGGQYTKLVLEELYEEYNISPDKRPLFIVIKSGDIFNCGSLKIEVISSSHTCLDSFGLLITNHQKICIYHTGDMKTDNSTYFRPPTDLKRLERLKNKINFVVADFYGANNDGLTVREVDTFKKLSKIIGKKTVGKVFIPVYPTHAEMYIIAFLAALKNKKNVIFYGNEDFYGYMELIKRRGIDFEKIAGNRIKISIGVPKNINGFKNNFAVIGTFNDIGCLFNETPKDSLGIITSGTFFNPLRGQLNARNIPFTDVKDHPELQGYGHGYWGDLEKINNILGNPIFIPTHCPIYMIDGCRQLAKESRINIALPTARNNHLYKLNKSSYIEISSRPANWLVVNYVSGRALFTEVWQKPTSGCGFLKRTFSKRRCYNNFKTMLYKRMKKRETIMIKKYTNKYDIRTYECDRNNNLRILTLLNIFQDMADNHAKSMGLGIDYVLSKGLAWVGSNYVLDIKRLPKVHEKIRIETWPAEEKRIGAIRDFEVFGEDNQSIIQASSQWILIDFRRKRPVLLRENLPEYTVLPERALNTDFLKIPEVERIDEETKFRVRFDDIDMNKHVNNAVYALWACEAVDPIFRLEHNPKHIEISFKKEGLMGEKIKVSTQCEGLHTFHSICTYDGNNRELARAYIEWE